MADEKMSAEDYLKKIYGSQLDSQKESLTQSYNNSLAAYDQQKVDNQKAADAALTRTAVEGQRSQRNFAELQNAYGLSSGAMAQARLAQNNANAQNMTAIRTQQQENDYQVERQKEQLKQQYESAIREAEANNNYELMKQLFAQAKESGDFLNASKSSGGGGYSYTPTPQTNPDRSSNFDDGDDDGEEKPETGKSNSSSLSENNINAIVKQSLAQGASPQAITNVLVSNGVSPVEAVKKVNSTANAYQKGFGLIR